MNFDRKLVKVKPLPKTQVIFIRKTVAKQEKCEDTQMSHDNGEITVKVEDQTWSQESTDTSQYNDRQQSVVDSNTDSIQGNSLLKAGVAQESHQVLHQGMVIDPHNIGELLKMNMLRKRGFRMSSFQKNYMIKYMGQHLDLAVGLSNGYQGIRRNLLMWEQLKNKLNSIGPPKNVAQWKTVWKEVKLNARKRHRLMLDSQKIGRPITLEENDINVIKILNLNNLENPDAFATDLEVAIEETRVASPLPSPEADHEPNLALNIEQEDVIENAWTNTNNSFVGDAPEVTRVASLAEESKKPTCRNRRKNGNKESEEDKAYLDLMTETNEGLQAISTSIQNLADSQIELRKVENERNLIFKSCLTLFKTVARNMNLMTPPNERRFNEDDNIE